MPACLLQSKVRRGEKAQYPRSSSESRISGNGVRGGLIVRGSNVRANARTTKPTVVKRPATETPSIGLYRSRRTLRRTSLLWSHCVHLLNKMPEKQQIQKLKSPGYVLSSSVERRWWPDASSGDRPGGALETRHACGGWGPFFLSDFAPAATMKDTWFYGPATVPTPRCKSCPSPRVPLLERVMLDNRFNFVVVAGTALMRMVMIQRTTGTFAM